VLLILRIIGWTLAAASALIIVLNLPQFYQYVIDGVRASPALSASGIPPEVFAVVRSVIRRFGELCFFALAIAIFLRSRDLMALLIAMAWVLFAVVLSGATIEVIAISPALKIPIGALILIAMILGALLLFTVPDGNFFPRWSPILVIVLMLVEGLRYTLTTVGQWSSFIAFIPTIVIYSIAIGAQIRRYRFGSAIYKHQFKWVLFGASLSLLSIVAGQAAYLVVPRDYHILTAGLDEVGSVFLALSMIIAVTRYHLYDINLFIHRSLVYGVVTLGLGLLFVLQFVLLENLLRAMLPAASHALSLILPAGVIFLLFNPVRARVQDLIDRRIYRFRFNLDQLEQGPKMPVVIHPGSYTGQVFGGFQLLEQLGRGGMGEVYKGYDGKRYAAVKVLRPEMWHDPAAHIRFSREAQWTAVLSHPNIVKTYDFGEVGGIYYLALEYIEGQTLSLYLREHKIVPFEKARSLMSQLTSALETAHKLGFVHRDIKPSNILLRLNPGDESEEAVLTDFGIAKVTGAETLTGSDAVGTITYMSPEQIQQSHAIDQRTDIYALGVMLFEMLTGKPPFIGTPAQVLFGHTHQPAPNPTDLNPDIPPQAAAAILRALAKDPANRFQHAAELAVALW
jgi:hypothetical protein